MTTLTRQSLIIAVLAALTAPAIAKPPPMSKPAAPAPVAQVAVITTAKGIIKVRLFPEEAPVTVANFIKLCKKGFYNGLTFHRVEPTFVVQGGDPKGDGTGGPGYAIKHENNKVLRHNRGAVAMANSGRDTAGSQFYIVLTKPAPHLDEKFEDNVSKYTIFGQVISGQIIAERLIVGDKITKVTIVP